MQREHDNAPDSPETLPALTAGLKAAYTRQAASVPPETDEAIRQSIRDHCAQQRGAGRRVRPRTIGWSGAIAALVALAVTAWVLLSPTQPGPTQFAAQPRAADVDRDGTVNILDAFALARMLDAQRTPDTALDLNSDGVVDGRDVDAIVMQAVSVTGGDRS